MIRAGTLNRRVNIQQPAESIGTDGATETTWSTFAWRWASIEPTSGSESQLASQTGATVTHEIRMRYLANVTTAMRIAYGSRVFNIGSVLNTKEAGEELVLQCTEAV